MSEQAGFVQGPPDISTGKKIANLVATLPAGTPVINADGTTTTLAAAANVFIQKVALADAAGNTISTFEDVVTQAEILSVLKQIRSGIAEMSGMLLQDDDDLTN